MKVLNILGSPRKRGTTTRIAESFVETARNKGAEVESHYLNGLTYKGCQGCEQCHGKLNECALNDELTPVLEAMRDADITVLSSPVYYGDTSGQFKMFLDRTWSHVEVDYSKEFPFSSRLSEGKKALFILTQGREEDAHKDVVERYKEFFELYGYELEILRATGLTDGAVDADVSDAQAQAVHIAEKFIESS